MGLVGKVLEGKGKGERRGLSAFSEAMLARD